MFAPKPSQQEYSNANSGRTPCAAYFLVSSQVTMTEGLIGIFLFAALIIGGSIFFHRKISRIWIASALTAIGASLLLQVISYIYLGYLDSFYMIAFVASLFWGLLGSLIIGHIMHKQA